MAALAIGRHEGERLPQRLDVREGGGGSDGFQTSVLSRPIFDPTSNTSGQIVVKKLWQVIGADLPPLVVGANGEPQPPGQGPLGQPGPSSPSGHPTVSAVNQLMRKFPDGWHPQLGGIYRLNMLVDGKITQADIMGSALKNNWNPIFVWSGTEAASTFRPLPADWPMTIVPTGASQTPVYMQALWIGEGEPFDSYKIDGDRDVFVLWGVAVRARSETAFRTAERWRRFEEIVDDACCYRPWGSRGRCPIEKEIDMPTEQPAVKTLVTIAEMFAAMKETLIAADFGPISDKAVRINVAHSAFETGFWHGMWNFNPGNAKSLGRRCLRLDVLPVWRGASTRIRREVQGERSGARRDRVDVQARNDRDGERELHAAEPDVPLPVVPDARQGCRGVHRGVRARVQGRAAVAPRGRRSWLRRGAEGCGGTSRSTRRRTCLVSRLCSRWWTRALSAAAVVVPPDLPTAPLPTCSSWMLAADAAATAIAVSISEHDTPTPWVPHGVYEETIGGVPWRFSMGSGPVRAVSTWKCVSSTPAHGDVAPPSDSGPFPSGGA